MRAAAVEMISPASFSPLIQNAFAGEQSLRAGSNMLTSGYQLPSSTCL